MDSGMMRQPANYNRAPAPSGYKAGLGRGATGFTTRSDIGPARAAAPEHGSRAATDRQNALNNNASSGLAQKTEFGNAPAGYRAGAGRGAAAMIGGDKEDQQAAKSGGKEDAVANDSNFDEWQGSTIGLFDDAVYEDDDREADDTYEMIDMRMDERRKRRREDKFKEALAEIHKKTPKIQEQFSSLKRELESVSTEEWEAIPDLGERGKADNSREKFTPVPDHILAGNMDQGASNMMSSREQRTGGIATPAGWSTPGGWATPGGMATPGGFQTPGGGMATPSGMWTPSGYTTVSDLTQTGAGRTDIMRLKLDRMGDSVGGQTVVDPKGYLTDLNSMKVSSDADIADIKKSRLLLDSVIHTNPGHAPGWIAAARLEEVAGKLVQARTLINTGCKKCPKSEDVWIEAARLHNKQSAKAILANAVEQLPHSIKIWLRAADMEDDMVAKITVVKRALELTPNSVRLWKTLVEMVNEEDARVLLGRAVECCPLSVDLWLALARLETYENARKVLNRAREKLPAEPAIWMTASELEEANGNEKVVDRIVQRALQTLSKYEVNMDREAWLKEAEKAEQTGMVATCQAVVRHSIGLDVEPQDRKKLWMDDAESSIQRGRIETARAIYAHALTVFPGKKSVWLKAAFLEKNHGSRETLDGLLRKATLRCPQAEVLWLMAAKEKWLAGDVKAAREILQEAYASNTESEEIWLAAVKLENENDEPERAKMLLARARERATDKPRVWMKSAKLEREQGRRDQEKEILDEGLQRFADYDKLWLMLGQYMEDQQDFLGAKQKYVQGIKACPECVALWLSLVRLELDGKVPGGGVNTARAILEKARLKNTGQETLWHKAVQVEVKAGNDKIASQLLAKGISDCPKSGLLWAQAIAMEPRAQRKAKSVDALKRCENDPIVIATVAKLFWDDRKLEKARAWFNRAVTLNTDYGDNWAMYYKFELAHGDEDKRKAVEKRCLDAEPTHGPLWCGVSKAPESFKLTKIQILKKVAALLDD
jgi:pre-mRNA-processing factor 6